MPKSRGINRPKKIWTDEEKAVIKALYPCSHTSALADFFKCELHQVYRAATKLGLNKSQWFKDSPMSSRLKWNDSPGRAHRFEKGHVPYNKGMKGMPMHPNAVASQFKKGNQPHGTQPIGSYRYDASNILQRKISNESGSNSKRWRAVHELVWIEHNGPVPAGHFCVFKPGMWTNILEEITIDRIDCINHAENMRRNSIHKHGKEFAQLHQLQGAITRQINKRSNAT